MTCFVTGCDATEFPGASTHYTNDEEQAQDPITMRLVAEEQSIQPGRPFWVALQVHIQSGWHTYWKNPGATGMPCRVEWKLPEGFTVRSLLWQTPKRYMEESEEVEEFLSYFGYEDEAFLLAEIVPSSTFPSSVFPNNTFKKQSASLASIEAQLSYVACNAETCLPGESVQRIELPVSYNVPARVDAEIPLFVHARRHMPSTEWKARAYHVEPDLVALTLVPPAEMEWEHVVGDFFPETEGADHRPDLEKNKVEQLSSKEFRMLLRVDPTEKTERGVPVLRGVLVFAEDNKTSVPKASVAINLPVEKHRPRGMPEKAEASMSFAAFMGILFCAFLGGALLNCMPCVLPVLSVKLMQLMKMSGESRRVLVQHAGAYTLGIVLSFWVLAGLIFLLQAYGQSVGWGFQLQEPLFVALLALFLLLFALNLFGLFEWGTMLASWAGQQTGKSLTGKAPASSASKKQTGLFSAFCSGVLATAVATPCTGPFLGSAVGFAVSLSPLLGLLIFTCIALGLSLPYVLLAISPKLMRYLPRPGAWMVRFKEGMGFLLLATVLWLVYVFAFQTNLLTTLMLLMAFLVASFGAWIYGQWSPPSRLPRTRILSTVLSAGCIGLSLYMVVSQVMQMRTIEQLEQSEHARAHQVAQVMPQEERWRTFSPQAVEEVVRSGKPAFVDFTASWCLICQANHYVLESRRVRDHLDKYSVVRFKADWTRSNPMITEALREHGRSGVPLYLLYPPYSERPLILPQLLTSEGVISALETMHQAEP